MSAPAVRRRLAGLGCLIFAILLFCSAALAQTALSSGDAAQRELIVAIKEAPPFAMKGTDGYWTGISIDLWRRIAEDRKLPFRFVEEPTVQGLIDGVAARKFDVAAGALTVTAQREEILEFTSSFYSTGLGIAVAAGGPASWGPVLRALLSVRFLQAVLALVGLALLVGMVVWLLERRHNEEFGGGVTKGLSSSVWWTAVAMTQRGIGHAGPRTLPGRMIAMIWMVGSIIAIAVFTASITSALTIRQLQGSVHGVTDLSVVRVGVVAGSSSEEPLNRMKVKFTGFPSARDGLLALRRQEIDAFVYDRPLMAWIINQDFRRTVHLLDTSFDPQNYAFALSPESPLRKPLNLAILKAVQSDWWDDTLYRYLGERP